MYLKPGRGTKLLDSNRDRIPVNVEDQIYFETEFFVGSIIFKAKDAPCSTDRGRQLRDAYFEKHTDCKDCVVIQGKFKKKISICDVFVGQEFTKPLRGMNATFVNCMLGVVSKNMAPNLQANINSKDNNNESFFMAPLITTAQNIHKTVKDADYLPNVHMGVTEEAAEQRRNMDIMQTDDYDQVCYNTSCVYTFEFYQSTFDIYEQKICAPGIMKNLLKIDASYVLNGQNLQVLCRTRKSSQFLWYFDIVY